MHLHYVETMRTRCQAVGRGPQNATPRTPNTKKARRDDAPGFSGWILVTDCLLRFRRAEAEGLEPPKACARRISSAVPYQLDYASSVVIEAKPTIGAPGFEPGTSATRTQRSTGLSHAPFPNDPARRAGQRLPSFRTTVTKRTGWDSNPRGLAPTRFPIVRLKPLGHPS